MKLLPRTTLSLVGRDGDRLGANLKGHGVGVKALVVEVSVLGPFCYRGVGSCLGLAEVEGATLIRGAVDSDVLL